MLNYSQSKAEADDEEGNANEELSNALGHSNEISIVDERKVNSNEALIVHLNCPFDEFKLLNNDLKAYIL